MFKPTQPERRERRITAAEASSVEMRDVQGAGPVLTGYAAVYYKPGEAGSRYMLAEDCEERILPGAFDRALRERQDIRGLFNHDANQVLGRTTSGTMSLITDARGLRYEISPPDTGPGRDVVTVVRRRDVTGSSFAFCARKDTITIEPRNGRPYYIRTIEDVDLFDVGPVTFPAYEATDAGARAAIVARAVPADPAAEADRIRAAAGEDPAIAAARRARSIAIAERS